MTFNVLLGLPYTYIVSIYRTFYYQNRLIIKCARKKKAKIPKSSSHGIRPVVPESRSFLVRYRRTYVLKINIATHQIQFKPSAYSSIL